MDLPTVICGKFGPDMNIRSLAVKARVTLFHWCQFKTKLFFLVDGVATNLVSVF
jgi:hypothetical protein